MKKYTPATMLPHDIATYLLGSILVIFLVPLDASASTPLDCEGVVAVPEGYALTQDATCSQSLFWEGDSNLVFDLGGFDFKVDWVRVDGSGLTIRNGKLTTRGIYWLGNAGKLSDLTVTTADAPISFFIEAGNNFTVEDSIVENVPGVAIDYYFGDGGAVRNSTFIGNNYAISIQKSSDVLIEGSTFVANEIGVNLWAEEGTGVNTNTIQNNVFKKNNIGVSVNATNPIVDTWPELQGNRIVRNQFHRNDSSGIVITAHCFPDCPTDWSVLEGTVVSGNHLSRNGFNPSDDPDLDDGVTARFFDFSENPGPLEALAGVTLSDNRADRNADLGFDVLGVTDGGGNRAKFNGNPAQCDGVVCWTPPRARNKQSIDESAALREFRHH
jgi:hypothetical protein